MSNLLKELMNNHGPCLSTDLTKILAKEHSLSEETARKRVSRGFAELKRLPYLTFPRKARFIYLQNDYNSPQYWEALKKSILDNSPAYGPALASLIQRGGLIPKEHFHIVCGAPLRQKKHLSSEIILSRLIRAEVVKELAVPGIGPCIALTGMLTGSEPDVNQLRARLVTEAILLKAIRMWVRNLGIASFNKVALRDEGNMMPKVGTFVWDLTGPSYLAPMVDWNKQGKPVPGFIACDILLGSEVDEIGLRPFLQKISTLKSLKRIGRCLYIFVADSYTSLAFRKAKEKGIIPATPETLFGSEVAQGLARLTEVLTQAAKLSINPDVFDELFQRLGKIEGATGNLRGALFEFIVAELVRQTISSQVMLNQIIKDYETGAQAEVDVLAVKKNRTVHFIECKGYHPSSVVADDEVERWLSNRIPLIRKYALQHPEWKHLELHFEFWTTGNLSNIAVKMIDKAKATTRKYEIEYRNAMAVQAYALEVKDPSLLKTLNNHFLEHPMLTIETAVEKQKARAKRSHNEK